MRLLFILIVVVPHFLVGQIQLDPNISCSSIQLSDAFDIRHTDLNAATNKPYQLELFVSVGKSTTEVIKFNKSNESNIIVDCLPIVKGASIHSFEIQAINGMPADFSSIINNESLVLEKNKKYCIQLNGTPKYEGDYGIYVEGVATGSFWGVTVSTQCTIKGTTLKVRS